jgi:hypothetical protein
LGHYLLLFCGKFVLASFKITILFLKSPKIFPDFKREPDFQILHFAPPFFGAPYCIIARQNAALARIGA